MTTSVYFQIQKKVFTKWINIVIQRTSIPSINDLQEGLADGVIICKLLEILSGKAAPRKYTQHAKSRHHKIQNLTITSLTDVAIALSFLNLENVRLSGCVPEDFADGKLNIVLSVIWQVILKYQIQSLSLPSENPKASVREMLLGWVRTQVKDYNIELKDFLQSWVDGFAFSILAYKFAARTLEPSKFTKENALENLRIAFAAGEEHFGIVPLLDPEDMLDKYIDELSVMTYVSFFPKAYDIASKAQEIVRVKRSNNNKANLDLSKATLLSPRGGLGSPRFHSPRLSLPLSLSPSSPSISPPSPLATSSPLSPFSTSSPPSPLSPPPGTSSPRPSAASILTKVPQISLVSLQMQQIPHLKLPAQPSLSLARSSSPLVTPDVDIIISPPSPTPSAQSPRDRSKSLTQDSIISPPISYYEGSPPASPTPSPRIVRHSPHSPRSPILSSSTTTVSSSSSSSSSQQPLSFSAPSPRRSSTPIAHDDPKKATSFSGMEFTQNRRRNSVNRNSNVPKEFSELGSIDEEKEDSGPFVLREVRMFVREINSRIDGERKGNEGEEGKKEKEQVKDDAVPWRRATIDGTANSRGVTPRWSVNVVDSEEASSNNNNRKRAWTRGSLEVPVVGKRGAVGGARIGNHATTAAGDDIATLKAKLEAMEVKNEENLQLLDEAKTKLEKAATCLHGLMRRTQESSFIQLDSDLLHEWQRKRETKLKHLQSAQDENSTLKVAMDIMHEELLYAENANEILHQNYADMQSELADCHKALADAQNERANEVDALKFEWRLALSEKDKLLFLLDKERKENSKLHQFYDEDQKHIQDIHSQREKELQKQLAGKGPTIPKLDFEGLRSPAMSPRSISPRFQLTQDHSKPTSPRQIESSGAKGNTKVSFSYRKNLSIPTSLGSSTTQDDSGRKQTTTTAKPTKLTTQIGSIDLNDLDDLICENKKEGQGGRDFSRIDSGNIDIHLANLINGRSRNYRSKKIGESSSTSGTDYSSQGYQDSLSGGSSSSPSSGSSRCPSLSSSPSTSPSASTSPPRPKYDLSDAISSSSSSLGGSSDSSRGPSVSSSSSPASSSGSSWESSRGPSIGTNSASPMSLRRELGSMNFHSGGSGGSGASGGSAGSGGSGGSTSSPSTASLITSPKIASVSKPIDISKGSISKTRMLSRSEDGKQATKVSGSFQEIVHVRRNTIGEKLDNPAEQPELIRRRSNSLFTNPSGDSFGISEPGNPEALNKLVEQQYDEMNSRLAFLREQINNFAARHYGSQPRKLQSKPSMKRRKPQHFDALEHVRVEVSWKKQIKSLSQLSCVCLIFNQVGQVIYSQSSVSKVQQNMGSGKLMKSRSLLRIVLPPTTSAPGEGLKKQESGFLESGIRFHTSPSQAKASMQGSIVMNLSVSHIPENGTSMLVLITPEDSDTFTNVSSVSTKVSTTERPKVDGSTATEKNWGEWNKIIPDPTNTTCETLALILLSTDAQRKWRIDFLCSEISELNAEELPLDVLQNSMVVKNYLPTKFQLEKCMEEFMALEHKMENWQAPLSDSKGAENEDDGREQADATALETKDREAIEAKVNEMLKEYNIPAANRWAGGDIFNIGNTPLSLFLKDNILYVRADGKHIYFEDWLSKFVKKIVRFEVIRSGTFGV